MNNKKTPLRICDRMLGHIELASVSIAAFLAVIFAVIGALYPPPADAADDVSLVKTLPGGAPKNEIAISDFRKFYTERPVFSTTNSAYQRMATSGMYSYAFMYKGTTEKGTIVPGEFSLRWNSIATDIHGNDIDMVLTVSNFLGMGDTDPMLIWIRESGGVCAEAQYIDGNHGTHNRFDIRWNFYVHGTNDETDAKWTVRIDDLDGISNIWNESVILKSNYNDNIYIIPDDMKIAGSGDENKPGCWLDFTRTERGILASPRAGNPIDNNTLCTGFVISASSGFTMEWSGDACGTFINKIYSNSTIRASVNTGGTITDRGDATVPWKNDKTYTIAADKYYSISSIIVDGSPVPVTNPSQQSYEFKEVTSDHEISASFARKQHAISYVPNLPNATGSTESMQVDAGTAITVSSNGFTPPGGSNLLFAGWSTSPDGSGASYLPGSDIFMDDDDITLYARWVPTGSATMNITWKDNSDYDKIRPSGDVTVKLAHATDSQFDKELTLKASEGYTTTFDYVYDATAPNGFPYRVSCDVPGYTMHDEYAFSYDMGDDTSDGTVNKRVSSVNLVMTHVGTVKLKVDKRWLDDNNAAGKRPDEITVSFKETKASNAVPGPSDYDAPSENQNFLLTFDDGERGQGIITEKTVTVPSKSAMLDFSSYYPDAPTWGGYEFIGWTVTGAGAAEDGKTQNIKLGAQWKKETAIARTFKIIYYNEPGANWMSVESSAAWGIFNMPEWQMDENVIENPHNMTISTSVPTRDGYVFDHWRWGGDTTTSFYPGSPIALTAIPETTTEVAADLYAVWTRDTRVPAEYTITWQDADGNIIKSNETRKATVGDPVSATESDKEIEGYIYLPDASSDSAIVSDTGTRIILVFEKLITVTWLDDDGTEQKTVSVPKSISEEELSAEQPKMPSGASEGKTFGGWEKSYDGENIVFRPVWNVTLTYDANGGSNPPEPRTVRQGQEVTIRNKAHMVHGGYEFLGWNTDKAATAADGNCAPGMDLTLHSDVTLYAIWRQVAAPVAKHYLMYSWSGLSDESPVYDANDELVVPMLPEQQLLPAGASYSVDTTYTSQTRLYTRDENGNLKKDTPYVFSGWSDPGNGVMGESNITITGSWRTVKILTAMWYGANGLPLYTVTFEKGQTEPIYSGATPTKASDGSFTYEFKEWAKAEDADGNLSFTAVYTAIPRDPEPIDPTPINPSPVPTPDLSKSSIAKSRMVIQNGLASKTMTYSATITGDTTSEWWTGYVEAPMWDPVTEELIDYKFAEESTIDGYALVGAYGNTKSGFVLSNSVTADLPIDKIWINPDGHALPESCTIRLQSGVLSLLGQENVSPDGDAPSLSLLESGSRLNVQHYEMPVVSEATVTLRNPGDDSYAWHGTISNVPVYGASGSKQSYRVYEKPIEGWSLSEAHGNVDDGYTVYNSPTRDVSIAKAWDDDNDAQGIRPTEVNCILYDKKHPEESEIQYASSGQLGGDGILFALDDMEGDEMPEGANGNTFTLGSTNHLQVSSEQGWNAMASGMPRYDKDGNEIEYAVAEAMVPGYAMTSVTGNAGGGFTVTNSCAVEDATVEKTWLDAGDLHGTRPQELTITIKPTNPKEVQSSALKQWLSTDTTGTGDLGGSLLGRDIDMASSDDASNSKMAGSTDKLEGGWQIDRNQKESYPSEITVTLSTDDAGEGTHDKVWAKTLAELPRYHMDGKAIQYEITESDIDGYVLKSAIYDAANDKIALVNQCEECVVEMPSVGMDGDRLSMLLSVLGIMLVTFGGFMTWRKAQLHPRRRRL